MDPRTQILTAAEELFAAKGFSAVGIRELTQKAGVNIAAVSYYFGSKEDLYVEMIRRYTAPLNEERMRRLRAVEAAGATAEAVFAALIEPVAEMLSDAEGRPHATRLRLAGRVFVDLVDYIDDFHERLFAEVKQRFMATLGSLFPEFSEVVIRTRFFLVVGMLGGAFVQLSEQFRDNPQALTPEAFRAAFAELAGFAAAGFAAPLNRSAEEPQ